MRSLFLGIALLTACGGAVEDGAPSPASGTNAPTSIASVEGGCTRACARLTEVCAVYEDERCSASCAQTFASPERESTFADCLDELTCDEIRSAMAMDYGPIGECFSRAASR